MTRELDTEAIQARYDDWYGEDDVLYEPYGDWSGRDVDGEDIYGGESMEHFIVRNDVPRLLEEVQSLRKEHGFIDHTCGEAGTL